MGPLDLESERYAPTGNLSGGGIQKSLGATALDALRILVREASQNVWDARSGDDPVSVRIHIRRLTTAQQAALAEMLEDLPPAGSVGPSISISMEAKPLWVLEVSDYGTRGLAGPVRADKPPKDDERPDFVNFLRNIGSTRDEHLGAGTYGYGKSSLYALSRCKTIMVYSQTYGGGRASTRFMGSTIGTSYRASGLQYTGRHWWGNRADDGHVDPVERKAAHRRAVSLGIAERSSGETGTSILIIDPELDHRTPLQAANAIAESLVWYFWPKMLADEGDPPPMAFEVLVDGLPVEVPEPDRFPGVQVFVAAMRALKPGKSPDVTLIECLKPQRTLGRLSLVKHPFRKRASFDTGDEEQLIPDRCSHVALMRPVKLVVKYLECAQIPSELVEYGGVFICNEDVEQHFADAEPPAHDDWVPGRLDDTGKRFVRLALRRIRETGDRFAIPDAGGAGRPDQPSLALIGDLLGGVLVGQDGGGPGRTDAPRGTPRKPSLSRTTSEVRISEPEAERPEVFRKVPCAIFRIVIDLPNGATVRVRAIPQVMLEGGARADADLDGPRVVGWLDVHGAGVAEGDSMVFRSAGATVARIAVSLSGDCAVAVRTERVE